MCGAVISTLEELQQPTDNRSPNLSSIVNRVIPSVEPLLKNASVSNEEDLIEQAVKANILRSVDQLKHGSDILEDLIKNDGLKIVGAEYSLETGVVDFLL